MSCKFYGIGVGPGDSELITIKAAKIFEILDILYVPQSKNGKESIAKKIANPYLNKDILIKERYFPMNYNMDEKIDVWNSISKEIVNDVKQNKNVGFVTLGDPMIYSTYLYVYERLKDYIEVVTIPGISSFINIASSNNFPLVMDRESLAIVSCTDDMHRIYDVLDNFESIVLMKVYKNFKSIIDLIFEKGLEKSSIMVSNSSMEDEVLIKDLSEVKKMDSVPYFTTILINKTYNR
ncbi:cobalt-factor II C(20)-methyltransferase [Peptostreptococcus canis]|uniref:Cobalt-precorrin-2 C(20)-methyltransferase n=1 Tax=Peptostreptococcus canis TaxID=1159213 RepID=A0ABR6TIR3_9FIRM|nr:cobalt-factor II C(20)-methyltransferase [Peptostreptococcus canis]MBC2575309.1 cobalt-factor II C(20)-methyltransferase [Peptostreptococcus canis]MBP1997508.1 sirohydrochlorin cobaltochelatase [Peptostreptococcus canis]